MPAPTTPTSFPPILPVAGSGRAPAPEARGEGGARILVAILALVVACAFVVDVGVPAKRPPEPAAAALP